jgi:hypothetical protein
MKEKKSFEDAEGYKDRCPAVVDKACAWKAEIIWDEILVIK